MTPKLELDDAAPDYLEWLLKTKGLEIEKLKKSVDKIESYDQSKEMIKIEELEQTKELLVHLTNKLFKKIETLEQRELQNQETEVEEKPTEDNTPKREECKIEFTDISWYRDRLNGKKP